MKKILTFLFVASVALFSAANVQANNYVANDQQIDQMLNAAPEMSVNAFAALPLSNEASFSQAGSSKDAVVAILYNRQINLYNYINQIVQK